MNIQKNIKNIIFDLGGVILNIDYHLTAQAFKNLGIKDFDSIYSQAQQNNLFNDLETGQISPQDFRTALKEYIPQATDQEIDHAWNAMLLDLPQERIELLKAIKGNYRIFLLSNTNAIHIKAFTAYVNQQFGTGLFENLFENHYYSSEIGLRKPNANAFQYVLDQNNLKVEETLFIDDSVQHIEGAKSIGLSTIWLNNKQEITSLFLDKSLSTHH